MTPMLSKGYPIKTIGERFGKRQGFIIVTFKVPVADGAGVEKAIKKLKQEGRLSRIDPDKGGEWEELR